MKVTIEYYLIEIMPDRLNSWIPCLNVETLCREEYLHLSDALKEYKMLTELDKRSYGRHCKYRIVRKSKRVNL